VKAARSLLAWSQDRLAEASGVSIPTIKRLEADDGDLGGRAATANKIVRALEAAGVEFTNGGRPGVRLRGAVLQLTEAHIKLLQQLVDLPEPKRVTRGAVAQGCRELEVVGYVKIVPVNMSDLLTEITGEGRRALAAIDQKKADQ